MRVTKDPVQSAERHRLRAAVVVATHERVADLRRAVDSLIRQTHPPQEIVVALCSGDVPTIAAVAELVKRHSAAAGGLVTAVQVDKNSVAAKENAGMAQTTADIVCFMDDDAVARPEWVERIVRHYTDPSVGAVGGRDVIRNVDGVTEVECRRIGQVRWLGRLHANHHQLTKDVREVDFLKGCNMSFRREVLPRIDPRLVGVVPYGFEIDMGLAVRARGYRIVYDPDAAVDHYPTSDMSARLASLAYVTNHNQTYILLKRFGWLRRIGFLLYTFLLGDRNTVGLLRVPLLRLRGHWPSEIIAAHFKGKIQGVRTFSAYRRAKPESDLIPRHAESADHHREDGGESSELQPARGGSLSTSR